MQTLALNGVMWCILFTFLLLLSKASIQTVISTKEIASKDIAETVDFLVGSNFVDKTDVAQYDLLFNSVELFLNAEDIIQFYEKLESIVGSDSVDTDEQIMRLIEQEKWEISGIILESITLKEEKKKIMESYQYYSNWLDETNKILNNMFTTKVSISSLLDYNNKIKFQKKQKKYFKNKLKTIKYSIAVIDREIKAAEIYPLFFNRLLEMENELKIIQETNLCK